MRQIINLINMNNGTIPYDIVQFNDGETHIKLLTDIDRKYPVDVITRIRSWNDLMLLMQVGDILKRMEVEIALYINYLIGMRMDRVISFNEAYTLKIIAEMINSIGADKVSILEPHSEKTLKLIDNSEGIDYMVDSYLKIDNQTIVVFPDAGAKARYGNKLPSNVPIVCCSKKRDVNTGEIIGLEIENPEVIENALNDKARNYRTFLVIDDLCDNGGTFVGISKLLSGYNLSKSICVTHLVSARGIKNLSENYDFVLVTNSFNDWEKEMSPEHFHVVDVFSDNIIK